MPQWKPRVQVSGEEGEHADDPADALEGLDELERLDEEQHEPETSEVSSSQEKEASKTFPQDNPWITVTEEETGTKPPMLSRLWQSHVRTPEATDKKKFERQSESLEMERSEAVELPLEEKITDKPAFALNGINLPPPPPVRPAETLEMPRLEDAKAGELSAGQTIDPQQVRRLPRLRVIGQLSQSYIVTEGEDGMYLIDQHAAHERILLERMVAALKSRTPISQLLLTPIELELAPSEIEAIEDHQSQLEHIGFTLEVRDGKILEVRAVPTVLVKQMNARSVHELLVDLTAPENLGHTETWEERALANVACKAAIKQNYFLTVSEMREMLEQLELTKAPYSCCHGRPTMVHFGLSALEREFGRR